MSYTNNHSNSSVVSCDSHSERSIPESMKLDTDDDVMSDISKLSETQSDSDIDDIGINWENNNNVLVKYVEKAKSSVKLELVLTLISNKMASVKKHINEINQHEALILMSSRTSKKRKWSKSTTNMVLLQKKTCPN